MITYEQDPDVIRWGLQFFESDPYSNCGYCDTVASNFVDYYDGEYFKEDHYGAQCCNLENGELLFHALQEDLSQLTVEAPGPSLESVDQLQSPVFPQEWLGQSMGNYSLGHESSQEADDRILSNSCSSPGEESYCGEDWSYSQELTDEYSLDGEVGKRLNQMVSVPHIPRINGEIPSVDEATLDHQRLLDRLQLYDLVELKVQGDGNCQFRALSDQFYRTPEHHEFVRQQVVNQLKSYPEIYEGYVPMTYGEYIEKMAKSGEWGDHVTLQAAADSYGVRIFVITSFKDTCYIEILPNVERSKRVICLSFWAEVHYNSIYPEGELPASETNKKKKRSRISRNKHLTHQMDSNNDMSGSYGEDVTGGTIST
ncbi:OVARIAN TUMOR DOMAIN-containing deubiquitinating enzyme 12-like [Malania oleifera]|uniref:OVARIAN TUMOR DOMAIN-containing deubiquitinating enzyme 12-like n=1 Tax=Malania oleifera TaxID=397392 RepID=UPI0025AE665B|nr:OVARIAN TUMOR DOMAIN-containing deubiquitinating enzyme 12-like [Malania oleifera]XP_057954820.1 OVARIAN TUMOR DOMAIN-containing deubiquitinating enzyme 12-like [Malania oleifera]XP_057954821.1 OVARIAN TUMOR DOMAIN-containing deubiquitinating enzyme 12-like [Malania oleifera]XP_057954822.1 OVARIAN TUMOR DOMAIN-containing deubiquitinating enzyme 12-like [Malania oleifera]XP_057954823.1 OVARIAN TUMOR DOMAIN-containing deubiquitinating enzyme 12-like [Malania oleifera]XP_057954825.1 OVARIAN TU